MKFLNQLTITSETGVGSSTLLKGLADTYIGKLPYRFVSGGAINRAMAALLGMTIEDFVEHKVDHPKYDLECDTVIGRFAEQDYVICEGRIPQHFMTGACHALVTCDLPERARRRQKQKDYAHLSVEDIEMLIARRDEVDNQRYARLYPGCLWAPERYDFVVDNTSLTAEETLACVLEAYNGWQAQAAST